MSAMLGLGELNNTQKNILFELSKQDASPKQLANKLNKTISYVSQQLKILYLAGYIKQIDVQTGKGSRSHKDIRSLYALKKELIKLTALIKKQ